MRGRVWDRAITKAETGCAYRRYGVGRKAVYIPIVHTGSGSLLKLNNATHPYLSCSASSRLWSLVGNGKHTALLPSSSLPPHPRTAYLVCFLTWAAAAA